MQQQLVNKIKPVYLLYLAAYLATGCNANSTTTTGDTYIPATPQVAVINYAVKASFPHDGSLFTEGFLIHDGKFFESTGSPDNVPQAKSMIGISDLQTGKFDKKIGLDKKYFGEGIALFNNKLYELTYKNKIGFVYDATSFKLLNSFTYKNAEGWSLTTDGRRLIMDDGTDLLTYLDPATLQPVKWLHVTENGLPRDSLNELEYIRGFLYANIWQNNFIVKIDTATGKVVGKLDLSSLSFEVENKKPSADVLNGIAYDSTADKIYVTGKLWPAIYQIEFAH